MRQAVLLIVLLAAALPAAAAAAPRAVRGGPAEIDAARAPASQLREVGERRSGRRRVTRYRQVVAGLPVLGSDTVVTAAPGTRGDLLVDGSRRIRAPARAKVSRARAIRAAVGSRTTIGRVVATRAILPRAHGARTVWRVAFRTRRPVAVREVLVDARTAKVLRRRNLARGAAQEAIVFDPNALTVQPGPRGTLADDSPDEDFEPLYSTKTLLRLDNPDCLEGAYAEVFFNDVLACRPDADFTTVADPDNPPDGTLPTTRSFDEFEAGMAYFHADRVQEYIQSLGIFGANNRRTRLDVNFITDDNSFYLPDQDGLGWGRSPSAPAASTTPRTAR